MTTTRNAFAGLIAASAMIFSVGFGYIRTSREEYDKHIHGRRARKNSGGRGLKRVNSPEYKAWKKAFSGLAVPAFMGLSRVRKIAS